MKREYTTQQIHALPGGKLRSEQTNVVNVTSDHRIITRGGADAVCHRYRFSQLLAGGISRVLQCAKQR